MILSRVLGANGHEVASISLGGMGQVVSSGFRSLYTAPPAGGVAANGRAFANDEPEIDLVDQARIEAFTQGFDEGCRVTGEANAADTQVRERLAAALELLAPAPSGTLAAMLSATVVRLVGQIVGEVAVDADLLQQRCEAVAAFMDENENKGALHLNPDDIPLIDGANLAVRLVSDASMKRGCVRLDTGEGWIEDGPDVRLSRLHALLDDMEGRA